MTASLLSWLDSIDGWAFLLGWVAISYSLGAFYIGTCLLTRRWRRWRRRKALDLNLAGHPRLGIDRKRLP